MRILLLLFIFIFSACSIKNYEHTQSKILIIKTKKFKYSDIGYIRSSGDALELELFVAGKPAFKVSIDTLVCTDEGCMSKTAFNEAYLNATYPDDIMQNIISGKSIYSGRNLAKTTGGFEQVLQTEDVNIKYSVDAKQIYFKDSKNNLIIKIKDIK